MEVQPGGVLRVFKDGVQIFQGHDISQFCDANNPAVGINQVRNFNSNVGTTAEFVLDNISPDAILNQCTTPLPFCSADVAPDGGDDIVNIDDLLAVINSWGQNGNPVGPRPAGDCAPGAIGDCLVNIDDLIKLVNNWGACPPITGACCVQGVCEVLTEGSCTSAPNFGTYQGDFVDCGQINCPLPPLGDLCTNPMIATSGLNNWNNANANTDGPVPPASCFPNGGSVRGDVWFRYTATCSGTYTFDTFNTAAPFTDTFLQVFSGSSCAPVGTMLACNDDIDFGGNNWLSRVSVSLLGGQTVLIRCASNGASPISNSGAARLYISTCQIPIPGCDNAEFIAIPGQVNASIQGTISGATYPNCLPGAEPLGFGRWYRLVGNGKMLTASTCESTPGSGWDGQLAVYCGDQCVSMTCVEGSNSFNCGPGGKPNTGIHESVTWCSKQGAFYWVFVGGDQVPPPPQGAFTLTITSGEQCQTTQQCGLDPLNDDCAFAFPIFNGTTTFSTVFATTDGNPTPTTLCNDTSPANQTVHDIWYSHTATCTGMLTVTTCPELDGTSNYDTDLVLYPGNVSCPPPGAAAIACNDDDPDHSCGTGALWQSTMQAMVTAGSSYLLRVGGWANPDDVGTGILHISCIRQVCGNGIVEGSEQCDDGNGIPDDGCTNCLIDADCSQPCVVIENEPCVQGQDVVNGGCNTTPAMYTQIVLKDGSAVMCGEAWATPVGSTGRRDLDWYAVTVGSSGRVEAHLTATTLMPMVCFVGKAVGPPGSGRCSNIDVEMSATATQGECVSVVRTDLQPGSTAVVIAAPTVFMGFPCAAEPWTYRLRVVSP